MHHKSPSDLGTRNDRLLREHIHDPYKTPHKLPEPTVCPECGAVYHKGRWQWITPPLKNAHHKMCQACHRIQDKYPAGIITLVGDFIMPHKDELVHLVRNCEAEEKQAHPLHRIMNIETHADSLVITTTDIHLPHRLGEALRHTYKGELDIDYNEESYFVRIVWQR